MRWAIHAAAPCPIDVKQKMLDWWGPVIWEYYGATEGGGTTATPEDWLKYPGTVGSPWAISELKITDDDGDRVDPGVPGTVWMKMGGQDFEYKGDKSKTDENHDADGFFTVGDIGYLNEDGFLFLCDRKSDMIIAGGVNIYPAEIEGEILAHPGSATSPCSASPTTTWASRSRPWSSRRPAYEAGDELRASIMEHLDGPPGQVQVAQVDRLRRRAPPRAHRQAPQAPAPRPVLGRPRPRDLNIGRPSSGLRAPPIRVHRGAAPPGGCAASPRARSGQPKWSQRRWVAVSSSSPTQVRSPTPLLHATRHENQTWPSTLAMAASIAGSVPSGKARSSTRCITSVVAVDAAPASRSSDVRAVITASASLG